MGAEMFPARIYVGQVVVVLAIVLATIWGATQWAAAALGHQPALGPAWCEVAGYPVYLPWRLFEWWYVYDAYAPHVFERAGILVSSGGVAGAVFAILNSVWRARQNQLVTTFGSGRWATRKEIAAAGLFKPEGVFLGRLGRAYLRHKGPEHVMCFAPTRSGKGVGLVLPTLLSWSSSAVVHDIKGENWQLTAGCSRWLSSASARRRSRSCGSFASMPVPSRCSPAQLEVRHEQSASRRARAAGETAPHPPAQQAHFDDRCGRCGAADRWGNHRGA
jgi:type IV secretion system protein VirD4